jgi:hypothetical protein
MTRRNASRLITYINGLNKEFKKGPRRIMSDENCVDIFIDRLKIMSATDVQIQIFEHRRAYMYVLTAFLIIMSLFFIPGLILLLDT